MSIIKDIIDSIIENNRELFGDNSKAERINVGFTNTVYSIDDKFIVKICNNYENEKSFEKEINFYKTNIENDLIPKLYYANTDKKDVPFYYEIIEKLEGVSVYNVWHTLSDNQREDVIRQMCEAMKQFHSHIGEQYDWAKYTSDIFDEYYEKAKELNLFDEKEQKLLESAYSKFTKLLETSEIVLIHNDLHFDNVFYKEGKIKLIDFERSMYAPRDYELNILYSMVRHPWKFASEETEKYTKLEDYEKIMTYIEKYYPELMHTDNLYKRLAIYDINYSLNHYIKWPKITELKDEIINAAKKVVE